MKLTTAIRRWWKVVLITAVAAGVIGAATTLVPPISGKGFSSEQVLASPGAAASVIEQARVQILDNEAVIARAADLLKANDNPFVLRRDITVVTNTESQSLKIRALGKDRDQAEARAKAVGDAFMAVAKEGAPGVDDQAKRKAEAEAARNALSTFDAQNPSARADFERIQLDTAGNGPAFQAALEAAPELVRQRVVLSQAVQDAEAAVTEQPAVENQDALAMAAFRSLGVKPAKSAAIILPANPLLRGIICLLVGAIIGAGLVRWLERTNPRFDSRKELTDHFTHPVIAEVPTLSEAEQALIERVSLESFSGPFAEAYRRLRSAIQFVMKNAPEGTARTFMICSASPGEGKTTTTAFAALALAEAGERTVVVGADYRRPSIDIRFGVDRSPGIRDLAEVSGTEERLNELLQPGPVPGLWVVSSGEPSTDTTRLCTATRRLVAGIRQTGAVTLIDTAPVLVANDAVDLLDVVDQVILVVKARTTTKKQIQSVLDELALHNTDVLGFVYVASDEVRRTSYRYYREYSEPTPAAVAPS